MDDITELKPALDKYPQVELLIIAARGLGHGVRTQRWNWALTSSSSDSPPVLKVDARFQQPLSTYKQSWSVSLIPFLKYAS